MYLGEEFSVFGNWFLIHFVENNGMAFGIELGGKYGKIILSIFRIIAVTGIGWYMIKLIKRDDVPMGFVVCISLIFAGAIGNIIDSAFYGLIFDDSYGKVAQFFPEDGGYATFLHGKVVDMFYFPLFSGRYPQWLPFIGGEQFLFFRPVFNVADSAITTGIFSIILFYWKLFSKLDKNEEESSEAKHDDSDVKEETGSIVES